MFRVSLEKIGSYTETSAHQELTQITVLTVTFGRLSIEMTLTSK